jgi:hypothetical protein
MQADQSQQPMQSGHPDPSAQPWFPATFAASGSDLDAFVSANYDDLQLLLELHNFDDNGESSRDQA